MEVIYEWQIGGMQTFVNKERARETRIPKLHLRRKGSKQLRESAIDQPLQP